MTDKRYHPFTNADIQRIIKLRRAGWHPKDIASMEGRTLPSINRLLSVEKKKQNLSFPKLKHGNLKWTDERIEREIAREYNPKTCNYRHLSEKHSMSIPRIGALMAKRAYGLQQGDWLV